MNAPNAEAKESARQLRECLFRALEAAIDNRWEDVSSEGETAAMLASHCQDIEDSYREEKC